MATISVNEFGVANKGFWSLDYPCRRCGVLIQCHHGDYAGGREFYEISTGRPHRCKARRNRGVLKRRISKELRLGPKRRKGRRS